MNAKNKIEKPDLKIGFIPIICSAPLIYAQSHGIFEKNGLEVELYKPSGWSGIKDLLVYDHIDAAHMLSPMPLACNLGLDGKKADIRLSLIQNINGQALTLSTKHIGIKSVTDMKGFTFGIPYRFSMHYYLLCYYLAAGGLDPLNDVDIKEIAPTLMPYYLRKGSLDGYFTAEPFNQIAVYEETGFIHILSKDIWDGHPCCSLATSQRFIDKYPNTYSAMVKSVLEAELILHNSNIEERKEIAREISGPLHLNQRDYIPVAQALSGEFPNGKGENFVIPNRIDFIPHPWPDYGVWMLSQMQRWSQLPGKVNYNEIVKSAFSTDGTIELAEALGFESIKSPSLGGIKPFSIEDPINYMLKQPFSAYQETSKPLKRIDLNEDTEEELSRVLSKMAVIAGGELENRVDITTSGTIGGIQHILNEVALNMKFMRDNLNERYDLLQKETEERLRAEKEAKDQLNTIFSSLKDNVFVISEEFDILYKNDSAHDLFGEDLVGRKCYNVLMGGETQCDICSKKQIQEGVRFEQEIKFPNNGGVKVFDIISTPIENYDGKPAFVELMRDITRIKRNEEELENHRNNLEKTLEEFAYVASHDLQEPLRMVASFTQLLQRRYKDKLDEDANEFINFAVDGATRMQGLINDLLIFSRVGTRGNPFKATDMNIVFQTVKTNLSQAIKEKSAQVTCDPLPVIIADDSQMNQLLQNLISNAVKFNDNEIPKVHLTGIVKENTWEFSLKDNGIGIDTQYFDRIFIIFQRLHKKDEYGGTGIGLAVCKKIIQRHGGKIWLESEKGKVTTFHFSIPRQISNQD